MTRYLVPRGILAGSAAERAVAAGLALPLAGSRLAFTTVDVIERASATDAGQRRALGLDAARALTPDQLGSIAKPRPH